MFDVFLIFTAGLFSKRHSLFANEIKSRKKSFVWVRSKIDLADAGEKGEEIIKEQAIEAHRAELERNLKEFHSRDRKVYLIRNQHPELFDFDQIMQAIADVLPSPQKECFFKIVEWKRFNDFISGILLYLRTSSDP